MYFFLLLVYYFIAHDVRKKTQVVIMYTLFRSSFCVLNFMLPASRPNLTMSEPHGRFKGPVLDRRLSLLNQLRPSQSRGYTQKNGAVSKVNKKFISHLTRAQRTPSAGTTVQVSHALPTVRFLCLLRGRGASFQDGVAAGEDFLCTPFWGVQIHAWCVFF